MYGFEGTQHLVHSRAPSAHLLPGSNVISRPRQDQLLSLIGTPLPSVFSSRPCTLLSLAYHHVSTLLEWNDHELHLGLPESPTPHTAPGMSGVLCGWVVVEDGHALSIGREVWISYSAAPWSNSSSCTHQVCL